MNGIKVTAITHTGSIIPAGLDLDATYSGDDVDLDQVPFEAGGLAWKQPVRVATTAAITIATALNAGDAIDGVTLAAGDRVLVKDQAASAENGIYVVDAAPYRAGDLDEDDEVLGAVVYVVAGTVNAGRTYRVTNTVAVVIDTDAITWAVAAEPTADAHLTDATDAHDASAISIVDAGGNFVGTDVEAALAELATGMGGTGAIKATISGGGAPLAAGFGVPAIDLPWAGTITAWTLIADVAGTITIGLWRDVIASYPPTAADTICGEGSGGVRPYLSTETTRTSSVLTNWVPAFSAGDVLRVNLDAVDGVVGWVELTLEYTR